MSDTAVAEAPAAELEIDVTNETDDKAFVIKDYSFGNSKVVMLGRNKTRKDGTEYVQRFFAVEHFFKNATTDKWGFQ